MSDKCEWCISTSEKIDSLEYQVEQQAEQIKQLQDEIAELKNNPADPWKCVLNEEGEL